MTDQPFRTRAYLDVGEKIPPHLHTCFTTVGLAEELQIPLPKIKGNMKKLMRSGLVIRTYRSKHNGKDKPSEYKVTELYLQGPGSRRNRRKQIPVTE